MGDTPSFLHYCAAIQCSGWGNGVREGIQSPPTVYLGRSLLSLRMFELCNDHLLGFMMVSHLLQSLSA